MVAPWAALHRLSVPLSGSHPAPHRVLAPTARDGSMKLVLRVLSLDQSTADNPGQLPGLDDDRILMRLTLCFAAHLDCAAASPSLARSLFLKMNQAMKAATRVPATTQLTAIAIFSFKTSPPAPGLFLLVPALVALGVTSVATETPEGWTVPDTAAVPRALVGVGLDIPMVLAMRLP